MHEAVQFDPLVRRRWGTISLRLFIRLPTVTAVRAC